MKIVLLGATGETGKVLLDLCLARGHEVVAAVRDSSRMNSEHPNLRKAECNIFSPESLTPVFRG